MLFDCLILSKKLFLNFIPTGDGNIPSTEMEEHDSFFLYLILIEGLNLHETMTLLAYKAVLS